MDNLFASTSGETSFAINPNTNVPSNNNFHQRTIDSNNKSPLHQQQHVPVQTAAFAKSVTSVSEASAGDRPRRVSWYPHEEVSSKSVSREQQSHEADYDESSFALSPSVRSAVKKIRSFSKGEESMMEILGNIELEQQRRSQLLLRPEISATTSATSSSVSSSVHLGQNQQHDDKKSTSVAAKATVSAKPTLVIVEQEQLQNLLNLHNQGYLILEPEGVVVHDDLTSSNDEAHNSSSAVCSDPHGKSANVVNSPGGKAFNENEFSLISSLNNYNNNNNSGPTAIDIDALLASVSAFALSTSQAQDQQSKKSQQQQQVNSIKMFPFSIKLGSRFLQEIEKENGSFHAETSTNTRDGNNNSISTNNIQREEGFDISATDTKVLIAANIIPVNFQSSKLFQSMIQTKPKPDQNNNTVVHINNTRNKSIDVSSVTATRGENDNDDRQSSSSVMMSPIVTTREATPKSESNRKKVGQVSVLILDPRQYLRLDDDLHAASSANSSTTNNNNNNDNPGDYESSFNLPAVAATKQNVQDQDMTTRSQQPQPIMVDSLKNQLAHSDVLIEVYPDEASSPTQQKNKNDAFFLLPANSAKPFSYMHENYMLLSSPSISVNPINNTIFRNEASYFMESSNRNANRNSSNNNKSKNKSNNNNNNNSINNTSTTFALVNDGKNSPEQESIAQTQDAGNQSKSVDFRNSNNKNNNDNEKAASSRRAVVAHEKSMEMSFGIQQLQQMQNSKLFSKINDTNNNNNNLNSAQQVDVLESNSVTGNRKSGYYFDDELTDDGMEFSPRSESPGGKKNPAHPHSPKKNDKNNVDVDTQQKRPPSAASSILRSKNVEAHENSNVRRESLTLLAKKSVGFASGESLVVEVVANNNNDINLHENNSIDDTNVVTPEQQQPEKRARSVIIVHSDEQEKKQEVMQENDPVITIQKQTAEETKKQEDDDDEITPEEAERIHKSIRAREIAHNVISTSKKYGHGASHESNDDKIEVNGESNQQKLEQEQDDEYYQKMVDESKEKEAQLLLKDDDNKHQESQKEIPPSENKNDQLVDGDVPQWILDGIERQRRLEKEELERMNKEQEELFLLKARVDGAANITDRVVIVSGKYSKDKETEGIVVHDQKKCENISVNEQEEVEEPIINPNDENNNNEATDRALAVIPECDLHEKQVAEEHESSQNEHRKFLKATEEEQQEVLAFVQRQRAYDHINIPSSSSSSYDDPAIQERIKRYKQFEDSLFDPISAHKNNSNTNTRSLVIAPRPPSVSAIKMNPNSDETTPSSSHYSTTRPNRNCHSREIATLGPSSPHLDAKFKAAAERRGEPLFSCVYCGYEEFDSYLAVEEHVISHIKRYSEMLMRMFLREKATLDEEYEDFISAANVEKSRCSGIVDYHHSTKFTRAVRVGSAKQQRFYQNGKEPNAILNFSPPPPLSSSSPSSLPVAVCSATPGREEEQRRIDGYIRHEKIREEKEEEANARLLLPQVVGATSKVFHTPRAPQQNRPATANRVLVFPKSFDNNNNSHFSPTSFASSPVPKLSPPSHHFTPNYEIGNRREIAFGDDWGQRPSTAQQSKPSYALSSPASRSDADTRILSSPSSSSTPHRLISSHPLKHPSTTMMNGGGGTSRSFEKLSARERTLAIQQITSIDPRSGKRLPTMEEIVDSALHSLDLEEEEKDPELIERKRKLKEQGIYDEEEAKEKMKKEKFNEQNEKEWLLRPSRAK